MEQRYAPVEPNMPRGVVIMLLLFILHIIFMSLLFLAPRSSKHRLIERTQFELRNDREDRIYILLNTNTYTEASLQLDFRSLHTVGSRYTFTLCSTNCKLIFQLNDQEREDFRLINRFGEVVVEYQEKWHVPK